MRSGGVVVVVEMVVGVEVGVKVVVDMGLGMRVGVIVVVRVGVDQVWEWGGLEGAGVDLI